MDIFKYLILTVLVIMTTTILVQQTEGWPDISRSDCVVVKRIDGNGSDHLCSLESGVNEVLELNQSTSNIVKKFSDAFGNCWINRGRFRITPVQNGCKLRFCNSSSPDGDCQPTENFNRGGDNNENTEMKLPDLKNQSYASCQCHASNNLTFDRMWMGVMYSPYDKLKTPCGDETDSVCTVPFSNYTENEFRVQMSLISTEFTQVAFYASGTVTNGTLWHWSESKILSSRIPLYLAEMNKEYGFLRLQGLAAIFRLPNFDRYWIEREKDNAINLTLEANKIFPGSIWGLSVHFNIIDDISYNVTQEINSVKQLVEQVKISFRESGASELQVGIRLPQCDRILLDDTRGHRPEQRDPLYCDPGDIFCPVPELDETYAPLLTDIDFVICEIWPSISTSKLKEGYTMSKVAIKVGTRFQRTQRAVQTVNSGNSGIRLIGQTGWPSQGKSEFKSSNTITNQRNFWLEMAKWSKKNQMQVYMFEVFDEQWKNNNDSKDKGFNSLNCGSQGYYGWWRRRNNSVPGDYIRKDFELKNVSNSNLSDTVIEIAEIPEYCKDNEQQSSAPLPEGASAYLIGGLLVVALFIGMVSQLGYRLRKAKRDGAVLSRRYLAMFLNGEQSSPKNLKGDTDHYEVIALRFPYDKKYEITKTDFQIDYSKLLGKGQCGTVYQGKIVNYHDLVAFKTTTHLSSVIDVKNLLSEIKIMSYIGKHENLVCFIGACTEKLEKGIVYVALEYCSLGSLDKYLVKMKNNCNKMICPGPYQTLGWTQESAPNNHYVAVSYMEDTSSAQVLSSSEEESDFGISIMMNWAIEMANGMEFLASKKVVHADLATRNILLTNDRSIKITDFGLSRKIYREVGATFDPEIPLPWRWMAPESLRRLNFSSETDIWSFGVTMWEIFSLGDTPYSAASYSIQFTIDLENGMRLEAPKYASNEIYEVMQECWKLNPSDRPSFSTLKSEFQKFSC